MAAGPSRRWTKVLGAVTIGSTVGVVVSEFATVWRRGHAPKPSETDHVLEAGAVAAIETAAVAVEGYRRGTPREVALFNLLVSFSVGWGLVRLSTHRIRSHGRFLIFRDLHVGDGTHVHHFVPGIAIAFLSGGASIVSRNEELDKYLAVPFGVGMAMTLDESALMLQLDDVYWSEEGVVSVQVALAAMATLTVLALGLRLLRRGEEEVLEGEVASPALSWMLEALPDRPVEHGDEAVESAS